MPCRDSRRVVAVPLRSSLRRSPRTCLYLSFPFPSLDNTFCASLSRARGAQGSPDTTTIPYSLLWASTSSSPLSSSLVPFFGPTHPLSPTHPPSWSSLDHTSPPSISPSTTTTTCCRGQKSCKGKERQRQSTTPIQSLPLVESAVALPRRSRCQAFSPTLLLPPYPSTPFHYSHLGLDDQPTQRSHPQRPGWTVSASSCSISSRSTISPHLIYPLYLLHRRWPLRDRWTKASIPLI